MNDCVTKPFTLAAIEACLARWVRPKRALGVAAGAVTEDMFLPGAPDCVGAAPVLHVLDEEILRSIARMAGPASSLVERVVALFAEHAPVAALRLKAAVEAGEAVAVGREAHALKSMCRNVGATRLAVWLEAVEQAAARDHLPDCAALDEVLGTGLQQTLAALEQLAGRLDCDAKVAA